MLFMELEVSYTGKKLDILRNKFHFIFYTS
jgi:hypothetical protein